MQTARTPVTNTHICIYCSVVTLYYRGIMRTMLHVSDNYHTEAHKITVLVKHRKYMCIVLHVCLQHSIHLSTDYIQLIY